MTDDQARYDCLKRIFELIPPGDFWNLTEVNKLVDAGDFDTAYAAARKVAGLQPLPDERYVVPCRR
jgi:hypothetical protein